MWSGPAAVAPIRALAWELPYAVGVVKKRKKKKKKKKELAGRQQEVKRERKKGDDGREKRRGKRERKKKKNPNKLRERISAWTVYLITLFQAGKQLQKNCI